MVTMYNVKNIRILIFLFLALISCRRPTIEAQLFEATFTVSSTIIHDGDTFSFTLKSNRSKIKVISFDFPLIPSLIKEDAVYDIPADGWIVSSQVSISKTQQGTLRLTIEDTETGERKKFEIDYEANRSANIEVEIENDAALGTKFDYHYQNYPAVIEGDDFSFLLRSKTDKLVLKSFNCEFNDGQLSENAEISFNGDKEKRYTFKSVAVDSDRYERPCELSLTFYIPETKKDTTITKQYIRLKKFAPVVTLSPETLVYKETCSVKIASNRQIIHLVSHREPEWFKYEDFELNISDLGSNLYTVFYTTPLDVPEGENDGELEFELKDIEYTGRTETITVPYHIAKNIPPQDISVEFEGEYTQPAGDTDAPIKTYQEELIHVKVTTTTRNSDNLYKVSVEKYPGAQWVSEKDVSLYAPEKGESREKEDVLKHTFSKVVTVADNDFFIRSYSTIGSYKLVISAANDNSVSKDINIQVRNSVVFVVELQSETKSFKYDICRHEWYYVPKAVTGYFASWENTTHPLSFLTNWQNQKREGYKNLQDYLNSLTRVDDVKKIIVTSSIDCGPTCSGVIAWNHYKTKRNSWYGYYNELEGSLEYPKPGEEYTSIIDTCSVYNPKYEKFILENAKEKIKDPTCYGDVIIPGSLTMTGEDEINGKIRPTDYWDHFNFKIESFEGEGNMYSVKYILYAFKAKDVNYAWFVPLFYDQMYWWKDIDKIGILIDAKTGLAVL